MARYVAAHPGDDHQSVRVACWQHIDELGIEIACDGWQPECPSLGNSNTLSSKELTCEIVTLDVGVDQSGPPPWVLTFALSCC